MESRARTMPGFLDFTTFTATDGERASIIAFDTWEPSRVLDLRVRETAPSRFSASRNAPA
jgi:hypothetical protein